jgi:hypothetical protein
MLVISVITTLCTAGVVFYLRFLFAVCKECKPRWISYPKTARPRLEEKLPVPRLRSKPRTSRAAFEITEIPRNTTLKSLRRDRI